MTVGRLTWLKQFLKSLGSSAVIAASIAAIAAIAGNYITGKVQDRSKLNEIVLTAFRQNQADQVATVKEIYDLVGRYAAAGDDLISITGNQFAPQNFSPKENQKNEAFFTQVRNNHDKVDELWRQKKYALGYLLSYHFHGHPEVAGAWNKVITSADGFEECVDGEAQKAPGSQSLKNLPCRDRMTSLNQSMSGLTSLLQAATDYLWEEMSPRK